MKRGIIKDKSGQSVMGMPFGLIFSIMLIVVFIVLAFIAIRYFLRIGDCSTIGIFYRDFESKINSAWGSTEIKDEFEISLPGSIQKICFFNSSARVTNYQDYNLIGSYSGQDNLIPIPPKNNCNMQSKFIPHLDIQGITKEKNPYCIPTDRSIKIVKGIYDRLVLVE